MKEKNNLLLFLYVILGYSNFKNRDRCDMSENDYEIEYRQACLRYETDPYFYHVYHTNLNIIKNDYKKLLNLE